MKRIANKLYPFPFCAYPILALWNQNVRLVKFSSVFRGFLIAAIMTMFLWLLSRFLIKDWQKAGLITTLIGLLFFSYGHIYIFVRARWELLAHHRYILGAYLVLFLLCLWLIVWKLKNPDRIEKIITITGTILLVSIVFQIGYQEYSVYRASNETNNKVNDGFDTHLMEDENTLPDVYWIILDAYGRSDVLMDYYEHDNSEFIQELTEMGFYVANCSQTNYPDTILSLVSTMNMDYLQNIVSDTGMLPQLSSSEVKKNFDILGYQTIAFENYFGDHYDLFEDVRLTRDHAVPTLDFFNRPNEFETLLMNTSLIRLFIDMPQLVPSFLRRDVEGSWQYKLYNQTLYSLDTLESMPELDRPIFVFAHLVVPHNPYIFNPDGSYLLTENDSEAAEKVGYRNNVAFVDDRLPSVIESIIENSEEPPIIIIQGDHGPTSRDVSPMKRMPILNAYFLPGETSPELYNHITPINTFRIIFNSYFGSDYELLDDLSYYQWDANGLVDQNLITNTCVDD